MYVPRPFGFGTTYVKKDLKDYNLMQIIYNMCFVCGKISVL